MPNWIFQIAINLSLIINAIFVVITITLVILLLTVTLFRIRIKQYMQARVPKLPAKQAFNRYRNLSRMYFKLSPGLQKIGRLPVGLFIGIVSLMGIAVGLMVYGMTYANETVVIAMLIVALLNMAVVILYVYVVQGKRFYNKQVAEYLKVEMTDITRQQMKIFELTPQIRKLAKRTNLLIAAVFIELNLLLIWVGFVFLVAQPYV